MAGSENLWKSAHVFWFINSVERGLDVVFFHLGSTFSKLHLIWNENVIAWIYTVFRCFQLCILLALVDWLPYLLSCQRDIGASHVVVLETTVVHADLAWAVVWVARIETHNVFKRSMSWIANQLSPETMKQRYQRIHHLVLRKWAFLICFYSFLCFVISFRKASRLRDDQTSGSQQKSRLSSLRETNQTLLVHRYIHRCSHILSIMLLAC